MKVPVCTFFGFFVLLAISLVFACNELVNCSFADEKSDSSGVPLPKVNVLPPSQPLLSSEAAPCNAVLPMVEAPFAEMLPCELWPEIFSSCTADSLRPCMSVCSLWKNIVMKHELYVDVLCLLVDKNEANFERLLLFLKQKSEVVRKGLLKRIHDEQLLKPKVLMDLIVRLFMVADVFPIVTDLLRDPSIPVSKMFENQCRPCSVENVLADTQLAKRQLRFTPELVKAVFKDLTPKNFRPWLSLPLIFVWLMDKARRENTALALQIYPQLEGAVRLPAQEFPTLSCIEPLLPFIFPLISLHDENGMCIFDAYMFYLQIPKLQSNEEVMPKEMADKILDPLSLVEINEQSMKLLVPHLCPSFLKVWKERETEVGKPIIDQFLEISLEFKTLNGDIDYGEALDAEDLSVIPGAIASLAKIDSVPFFVYRPLIVRFIDRMNFDVDYDASKVPFSGIEYSPCFMEDLYVLAHQWLEEVHAFLMLLDPKQRSSLLSYSSVLTSRLFSHFKGNALDCDVLSAVPSLP